MHAYGLYKLLYLLLAATSGKQKTLSQATLAVCGSGEADVGSERLLL